MNIKKLLAVALVATLPIQGLGYVAYAQDRAQVDPEFMSKLEAALQQRPELVLMAAQLAQQNERIKAEADQEKNAVKVRADMSRSDVPGYILGNPKGTKTYVEFLDYRCGYCKRAHTEVDSLIAENSQARFVIIMRPVLGPDSETLARFAMAAAEQGKFAQTHDYLYEHTVEAKDAGLQAAAKDLGLDWAKVKTAMTSDAVTARLAANNRVADEINVNGTPFFITPKRVIPGATTKDDLVADIG